MGKTLVLSLFLMFFMFSFVSADSIGTFQVEEDVEIYQECFNCTYCNFTVLKAPSGTTLLSSMEATQTGTHWGYDVGEGNITEQGTYSYCYNCGNSEEGLVGCIDFDVTYTGEENSGTQISIYLTVLLFLIILLGYLISIYHKLPNHARNDDGYVINVSQLAYFRPIAIGLMWILIMAITFIVASMSIAYIQAGFIGELIFGIWTIMMYSNLIILPIWVASIIISIFKAEKIKEFLERGGDTSF